MLEGGAVLLHEMRKNVLFGVARSPQYQSVTLINYLCSHAFLTSNSLHEYVG